MIGYVKKRVLWIVSYRFKTTGLQGLADSLARICNVGFASVFCLGFALGADFASSESAK